MSTILAVMRIPPHPQGHGGSQRGWHLINALRRLGTVHFVLVSRAFDHDAATVSLDPLRERVASVTHIDIPEWQPAPHRRFRVLAGGWFDLAGMRSAEAPVLSERGRRALATQLPVRDVDVLFAGRLPSAFLMDALLAQGALRAARRVADFDDIMSRFREIELRASAKRLGKQGGLLARIDLRLVRRAEDRIAQGWDGISVCTDEDVAELRRRYPHANVHKLPNVIERPALGDPPPAPSFRVLFVGNLSFSPNVEGLVAFVAAGGWDAVRRAVPGAQLTIVGINPNETVRALARDHGFTLHADVPSVEPYYRESDVVIAPILLGSGTRVKILEALAYGRAVVSTPLGASGLDLVHGRDALLADTMSGFADAIVVLAHDAHLRATLARNGRAMIERNYSPAVLDSAVAKLVATPVPIAAGR